MLANLPIVGAPDGAILHHVGIVAEPVSDTRQRSAISVQRPSVEFVDLRRLVDERRLRKLLRAHAAIFPGAKCGHVDDAVGDGLAHVGVVEDAEQGDALALLACDHLDDHLAVLGVERGGRLVEQQDRMRRDEAARDVDALLLAAGEGRGRQAPEPLRQVEAAQAIRGPGSRAASRVLAARHQRLGDDVERRDARHRAQELADIADRVAAHGKHGARAGRGEIDELAAMIDDDLPGIDGVVAVEHLQDRALAGARRAAEHGAFARLDGEGHAFHDRQADAVAQMHGEALRRLRETTTGVAMVTPAGSRRREAACRARADRRAPGRSGRSRRPGRPSSPSCGATAAAPRRGRG